MIFNLLLIVIFTLGLDLMHNIFPEHSHKEYVARYLDKILCCHYNSNNIHTYARSDYRKTNQTSKVTVAKQRTDKGQADSGILSHTFGTRPL